MKALLVVDVPKEWLENRLCVTISNLNASIKGGMSFNTELKPLPEEKSIYNVAVTDFYDFGIIVGWNACLNEIAGE